MISFLVVFLYGNLLLAQAIEEHNGPDANYSQLSVDKFIKHAPGKYEHFDLLYLLDYKSLNASSPSPDACPNIMVLGDFSKVDNNTADLEFTRMVLDSMRCSATPMTKKNALRFIRLHLDMFFNPQQTPLAELHDAETHDQFNPLQEPINHLRELIDNNMFQWYAQIQPNVVSCLPEIDPVEEGSMFVIDAHKFFSFLLDSIRSLRGTHEQPPPEMSPQANDDLMKNNSHDKEQRETNITPPTSKTAMPDDILKNMSGEYFFSYVSPRSSCLYVQQKDVQMLRDIMRLEERKAIEEEENEGLQLTPDMTITASSVCNCGEDYPRTVEIRVVEQTHSPKVRTDPFSGRFLRQIEAMLLSPWMWSNSIERQAEEEGDNETRPVHSLMVKFDETECAVSRVLSLSDIVHQIERPSLEGTQPQNGDGKPAAREFVEAAVILKYFQEVTGKQGQQIANSIPIETMLEMSSQLMLAADKVSRVLVLDKGSSCGAHVIEHDTIVLVEHRHIFEQIRHLPIYQLLNSDFTDRLLGFDDDTRRFTIHVLQDESEGIGSCTYASSEGAIALLSTQCQLFHALGSGGFRFRKNGTTTSDAPEPSQHVGDGGNHWGEGINPNSTETPRADDEGNGVIVTISEEPRETSSAPELEISPEYAAPAVSPSASKNTTSGGGNNENSGKSRGGMCFPAEALATLEDGTMVPMTTLKVGDIVADGTGGTSKILVFAHQDHSIRSEFIRIITDQGDIVLSPSHYIYTNKGLMTAESVLVGDQIETVIEARTGLARVTHLFREMKIGLFNPITVSGSLAVAGNRNDARQVMSKKTAFKTSCFTSVVDVATSATLVSPLRWLEKYFGIFVPVVSTMFKKGNQFWPQFLKPGTNVSYSTNIM